MLGEGVHKMSLASYINDPAPEPSLNAGVAHILLTSTPLHAKAAHPKLSPNKDREDSSRLDFGTIAHAILLENDRTRLEVIDADDWRKKETKEKRDEARAYGKLPVLRKEYDRVEQMVLVAKATIAASEIADDFAAAIPEQTLVWQEEGVWCRSRPDKATADWRVSFDYKTCAGSANPMRFGRTILQQGYDLQCALARRGIRHLFDVQTTFVFLAQEIEPPYALAIISLDPSWLTLADDKIRMAMSIWKGCLRTNEWASYPSRIAYVDAPAWAMNEWETNLPPIDAADFI